MKKYSIPVLLLIFAVIGAFSSCKNRKSAVVAKEDMVQVKVLYTEMSCGGAAPTPEIQQEMERPKPYANQKVYVAQFREEASAREFKTDKAGIFTADLDTGFYEVYFYNPAVLSDTSIERTEKEDCERMYKMEMRAPLGIRKGTQPGEVMLMKMCNPCEEPRP